MDLDGTLLTIFFLLRAILLATSVSGGSPENYVCSGVELLRFYCGGLRMSIEGDLQDL